MRKLLRFICEPIFRERMQIKYILNHDRSGFLNYIMTEHLRGKYNLILSKDAEIEEDVWFPHPHNIIVGGVVKIGKKCVLYHDVKKKWPLWKQRRQRQMPGLQKKQRKQKRNPF